MDSKIDRTSATCCAPADRATLEIVRTQKDLTASVQNLSILLDALPVSCAIINDQRQIITGNSSFMKIVGVSEESALLGLRPGEALQCVGSSGSPGGCGTSEQCRYCGILNAVLECRTTGKSVTDDSRVTIQSEGRFSSLDLRVTAASVNLPPAGEFMLIFLEDISDRKWRSLIERIFFHDVINTAGAMKEYIKMAAKDEMLLGHDTAFLDDLGLLADTLYEEISAQRDLVAAENNDLAVKVVEIDIPGHLAGTLKKVSSMARARGLTVGVVGSPDVRLMTDGTLLSRVLLNLLKNAMEASRAGDHISLGCRIADNHAVFSVHNPAYIPVEVQSQVFHRSFSTKGNDRGLGAYSVKILTEKYLNGKVEFSTHENTGTTFMVSIPL